MSKTQKEIIRELYADCSDEDLEAIGMFMKEPDAHTEAYNKAMDIALKQVGGNHYQNKIQPWEIIDSWELNFYEGNILKYLLRRKNNRIEDLQKMIHYAEKLLELELLK